MNVLLYNEPVLRYKLLKIRQAPYDLRLTLKTCLSKGHFCTTTKRFRDARLSKIRNASNDLRLTLKIQLSNVPIVER